MNDTIEGLREQLRVCSAERDAAQQIAQYERDVAAQAVQAMTAAVRERDERRGSADYESMKAAFVDANQRANDLREEIAELRARLAAAEQTIDGVCEATKHLVRDGEAQELAEHVNSIVGRLAACERVVKAACEWEKRYGWQHDMAYRFAQKELAAAVENYRTAVATAQGE
jgi:uncharacterized coiled-coil DUF342 family protein